MKLVKIQDLKCNGTNKNVELHYLLSKPKVDEANYRLQEFNCSNKDNCDYYRQKKCPNSELWKIRI